MLLMQVITLTMRADNARISSMILSCIGRDLLRIYTANNTILIHHIVSCLFFMFAIFRIAFRSVMSRTQFQTTPAKRMRSNMINID